MIDLKTLEAVKGGPIKFDKRKFDDDVTVTVDASGNEIKEEINLSATSSSDDEIMKK